MWSENRCKLIALRKWAKPRETPCGDLDNAKLDAVSGAIWTLSLIPEHECFLRETLDNNRYREVRAAAGNVGASQITVFVLRGPLRQPTIQGGVPAIERASIVALAV